MATITTDTFLDTATGTRTAGEAWTMNGCTLTIRTDTRWYSGAPASMTGTLGTITLSSSRGGGLFVDGTKVRWMPFDSGSGTVPAINTSITQGGVTGTFLGVWETVSQPPTAVGAAMPATGWIKFREVTGGTFAAGSLSGIGANATGPDVVGWIEVVFDAGASISPSAFGAGFKVQGEWFDLGTTTGNHGQEIFLPSNGPIANPTCCLGVQIETAPGSGIYEWYPALLSTNLTTSTIATDARAKIVAWSSTSRSIVIGRDIAAGTAAGYTPPSGCKIRTPNVFFRHAATGSRSINQTPSASFNSRPIFQTANGGTVEIDKASLDFRVQFEGQNTVSITNSITENSLSLISIQNQVLIDNCCSANAIGTTSAKSSFTSLNAGQIKKLVYCGLGNQTTIGLTACRNVLFEDIISYGYNSKVSASSNISIANCDALEFNRVNLLGFGINLSACNDITFKNVDYIDRSIGSNAATPQTNVFTISTVNGMIVDGFTCGQNSTIPGVHVFTGSLLSSGLSSNVFIRNAGTFASPIPCGTATTQYPTHVVIDTGNSQNLRFQRLYFGGIRTGIMNFNGSAIVNKNMLFEGVYSMNSNSGTGTFALSESIIRNVRMPTQPNNANNTQGVNVFDIFNSDTTGRIRFQFSAPSVISPDLVVLNKVEGSQSGFTGQGAVSLITAGDSVTIEPGFYIKGHTALANSAPTFTASGSYTYEYQIDNGSGYSAYKILNQTNIATETLNPAGFKIRVRATCLTTNTANNISLISIPTVTTVEAQTANLYPLDTVPITITNLIPGSEVRAYVGSDPATAVEIAGVESSGTSFSFNHSNTGQVGFIRIFALGYQPYTYDPYTYPANATELLVQQVVDRNYVNPA